MKQKGKIATLYYRLHMATLLCCHKMKKRIHMRNNEIAICDRGVKHTAFSKNYPAQALKIKKNELPL